MNKIIITEIENMHWNLNMTFKQISEKLGVSVGTIHNTFKRFNIPAKKRGHIPGNFKHSKDTLLKISETHKGKKQSEETRIKIGAAKKEFYKLGNKPPKWNGGRREKRGDRYIQIHVPKHPFASKEGYVMEHRLVMEQVLGRYLQPNEIVHHINKKRQDNRPENLMIFASDSDHQKYHSYFRRINVS